MNLANALARLTALFKENMRPKPVSGLRRLKSGARDSKLRFQPPSNMGASRATTIVSPRIGAQAIRPWAASVARVEIMSDWSTAWSRVRLRLEAMRPFRRVPI